MPVKSKVPEPTDPENPNPYDPHTFDDNIQTEQPKALDNSILGVKSTARKNLEYALLAVDSAYLLIEPTSFNSKDAALTVLSDLRDDVVNAIVVIGNVT